MEEWQVIEEASGYLISNYGRVQNRNTGRILKGGFKYGYPTVTLAGREKYFTISVHRLVASAFVDGEEPGLFVRHIDGVRTNNFAENLEWMTREEHFENVRKARGGRKLRSWELIDGELVERERD